MFVIFDDSEWAMDSSATGISRDAEVWRMKRKQEAREEMILHMMDDYWRDFLKEDRR